MLKAKLLPEAIKNMLTIGFVLAAPAGETIRELATVIGEQFDDLGRACLRHFVQESMPLQLLGRRRSPCRPSV